MVGFHTGSEARSSAERRASRRRALALARADAIVSTRPRALAPTRKAVRQMILQAIFFQARFEPYELSRESRFFDTR